MNTDQRDQARLVRENEDLRRQVAALQEQVLCFKATLYSIGDAVISTDADGHVLRMNRVAEALTGWSEVEAQGRPIAGVFTIVDEESRSEVESPVARVLRDGAVVGLANHTLLIAKDGTERPIADSGAPIRDETGKTTGAVLVFSDRSEERVAQRALSAAVTRHKALLASVPDIVMEVDANKVYTWANQPGLNFFGSDVLGREAAFYFEGEQDTYDRVQPLFGGDDQVFYVESWQRRSDGEKRLLAWWCRVLKDDAGNVTGALSTARDVTEERSVAAELHHAEERFRTFFDHAPIGKSMTAPDGKLLRVNPALGAMLGYSVEELQTTSFVQITHPDDLPESRECIRCLLASECEQWSMDKRYLAKDGHLVWTHVVTRLQRDSQGKPLYLLTHVLDITARKRAEQQLRERIKELRAFYGLTEIIERKGLTPEELYQELVNILPASWQYPEVTCARMVIGDREFCTANFAESPWMQAAQVRVGGSPVGRIDVGYLQQRPEEDEGPFLKEERLLIDALGERVSGITERMQMEKELRLHRDRLEEMIRERTAELSRTARALHESERRLAKETAVVAEIVGEMLSGDLTDAEAERQVLDACLDVTGSTQGLLGIVNQQGKFDATTYGGPALNDCAYPEALAWEMSTGMEIRGIGGCPMIHGKPLLCNDPAGDRDRIGQPEGHVPVECFLCIPVKRQGKVTGMVAVANKPGGYTEADEQTLARLVDVMVVSQQHRALAAEREASELRYRRLFEAAKDGILILDAESGKIVDVNPFLMELTGRSREDFLDRHLWETGPFKDIADSRASFANLQAKKYIRYDHLPLEACDGRRIDVEFVSNVYRVGDKDVIQCNIRDNSARNRAENMVAVRLRLLEFAGAHSLGELLQRTLDEVESMTGSRAGFYHFVAEDQRTLSLQAWSTRTVEEFCTAQGAGRHYDIDEAGVWVDCVRQRRPVIHNDYAALPHKKGLPEGHAPLVRELVVPILRHEKIVAVLGVGNKATDFTEDDVNTVAYLADVAWEIAERKRADEALWREKDFVQRLIDTAQTLIVVLDAEGRITRCNRLFEQITGYQLDEVRGKDWFDTFLPARDRARIRQIFLSARSGIPTRGSINPIVTKDGREREIEWCDVRIEDDAGNPCLLSTGQDITERKQAEQDVLRALNSLSRRTRELEGLLDGARAVLSGHDFETIARRIFDVARELTGARSGYVALLSDSGEENELVFLESGGLPCEVDPALPMPVRGLRAEAYASGEVAFDNAFMKSRWVSFMPEGHVGLRNVLFAPLNIHGKTVGIMGLANKPDDFNDDDKRIALALGQLAALGLQRWRAEQALRAEEEKYRLLADNTLDVIWTMSLDLEFKYVNPAITRVTGHTAEQWIGSKLSEHFDQAACADIARMLAAEVAKGPNSEGVVFETSMQRADGQPLAVEVHAKLVCDEVGTPILVQGITHDITERQELHAQLAQSDRLRTIGTLAAGVAHEINNPLSYVLYNIESLSEDVPKLAEAMRRCYAALCSRVGAEAANELLGGEDSFGPAMFDDVAQRFRDALSGTVRIKDIVRGLGTFSRVEKTELVPISVHRAVEQAINMAFNEIKYRARVVKDFGQVPMVLGSDGKLAQVFLNLLINAAHAIREGHVEHNEIRVRTWADGDQVLAEVSDTGKGIAPEHQAKVFEPFFTTKGVGVGTGLGLSICRSIVEGFGGQISFTSEVGTGTRFAVRLPRVPVDWETQGQATQEPSPGRPRLRGRILVVDDEAGIRGAIVRMLGREHEVIAVSSGEEAQNLLENDRRFDLIFCDLMMPEMSGMELHAWLVQREPSLAGQVVFITGGAFTPGASDYLLKVGNLRVEKPFDTVAFKKTAEELVLAARAKRGA